MLEFAEIPANVLMWTIMGGILLAVLGLLFAPVAGTICSLIAWIKRYPRIGSYWGTGAWYSILLIAPWVYLVIRMAGFRPSDVLVRIWYAIFFGYWSLCVLSLFGASVQQLVVEEQPEATILLAASGVALAVVESAAIRRLLRRGIPNRGEASAVMRRAYVLLQSLWLGSSAWFVIGGLREIVQYSDRDGAILMIGLAGLMILGWWIARSNIQGNLIDSLDFPGNVQSDAVPPDKIYTEPFAVLWIMATAALGVTIAGWIVGVALWASG